MYRTGTQTDCHLSVTHIASLKIITTIVKLHYNNDIL